MYTHSCRCARQDFAAAGPCRKARSSDVFRALDPPSDTRQAICALAALVLLDWVLQDVWSIPLHGLELSLDFGGVEVFFHHFIFPAVAIAGAALALKDRRLAEWKYDTERQLEADALPSAKRPFPCSF